MRSILLICLLLSFVGKSQTIFVENMTNSSGGLAGTGIHTAFRAVMVVLHQLVGIIYQTQRVQQVGISELQILYFQTM